ncbi:MAG: hypothetical protein JWQ64_3245 [Subtercola sp.]|jgi:hypothetical protein|nr:hypothetical protein [Subtercola sp.]
MTDTNEHSTGDETELDRVEEGEDKREKAQLDESLEEEGLLPAPDATPSEGPAPAA